MFRIVYKYDPWFTMMLLFNPLPDDQILALSNLKAFADNKVNITPCIKFVFHRIENIVGKGENVTSIFSFSHNVFNPFSNEKFKTFPNSKSLQRTVQNLMKMAESSPNGCKTLWEKEKLLVMSNFFFSHSVFKRLILQTHENQGPCL